MKRKYNNKPHKIFVMSLWFYKRYYF